MRFFDMFLATMFLIICLLLIVVVLLQKGRGGGLSAAFGGAASTAFGTRVGDVFTWVTIVLTALFLLFAVGTTMWFRPAPEQVIPPFFTPSADRPFTEPVDVTITCPTSGANIYYTLDGSIPDKDSTLYESPVRVEPGHRLIARAYRPGRWTPSRVVGGYYGPQLEDQPATKPTPGEPDEILAPISPAEPDERPAETQPSPSPSGQPGA